MVTSIESAPGWDEAFGTEGRVSFRCVRWLAAHGAIVIDDIVPGHTGKGADFGWRK